MQDFTANSYKIENFYANGGTRGYYEAQSATEVKCTGRVATPGEPSLPPTPGSMLYGGASQLSLSHLTKATLASPLPEGVFSVFLKGKGAL